MAHDIDPALSLEAAITVPPRRYRIVPEAPPAGAIRVTIYNHGFYVMSRVCADRAEALAFSAGRCSRGELVEGEARNARGDSIVVVGCSIEDAFDFAAANEPRPHRLTPKRIAQIAARYGRTAEDIAEDVKAALGRHGRKAGAVYWATDEEGYYDAQKDLIGHLEQEQAEAGADGRAHAAFCRDAYGEA